MKKCLVPVLFAISIVAAPAALLLDEPFAYSSGDITNVAAPLWVYHSGGGTAATALNVVNGQAYINQNDGGGGMGDANRLLSSSFDVINDNTTTLFAGFTVNFESLPYTAGTFTAGSYFAHFKSSAANEFYGRIGANQEGADAGKFRLAITTEAWASGATTVEFPQDLDLGITYLVVMKYDLATDRATLWVDPTSEASLSVVSTDAPSYVAGSINAFALRQGTSGSTGAPGDLYVDNLRVATSFVEVVPEPSTATLAILGGLLSLWATRRRA